MDLPEFLTQDKFGYIHPVGHRVGIRHVLELYRDGYTADRLVDEFPTLSLTLIRDIIAFYEANRAEVDAYIARCQAEVARQAAAPRQGPDAAELGRRMEALRREKSA
jgi:uncharacterized protein (DUF433 family)